MASINLALLYAITKRTEEMMQVISHIISQKAVFDDEAHVMRIMHLVLLKKQYRFLLHQFMNPELQLMKYARPFYYVLAWFMRDELPGEYEKVGPEIKETVDEIIQALQTNIIKAKSWKPNGKLTVGSRFMDTA
jgi:hypothetical protein